MRAGEWGWSLQPRSILGGKWSPVWMLLKERLGEAEMGPRTRVSPALGWIVLIMGCPELSSIPGPTSWSQESPRAGKHWAACTASLPCLLARVSLVRTYRQCRQAAQKGLSLPPAHSRSLSCIQGIGRCQTRRGTLRMWSFRQCSRGLMEAGKDTLRCPRPRGAQVQRFGGVAQRAHLWDQPRPVFDLQLSPFWLYDSKKPHNQIFPIFSN